MHLINKLKLKIHNFIGGSSSMNYNTILYAQKSFQLTQSVLNSQTSGISDRDYTGKGIQVIVSLTTYGKRLYEVYLTIESIMQQTIKPNKIVLWLADDLKSVKLPETLIHQRRRGLDIRFCKDIKSYKKLIPSLKEFPEDIIITVDDDILYRYDLIENLLNGYLENPDYIYCSRLHRMKLLSSNRLDSYNKWEWEYQGLDVSPLNFPTTGAGTLYPPHCFPNEVFNESVFLNICKYGDDIWFKAMALLNGTLAKKVYTHTPMYLDNNFVHDTALCNINVSKGGNDKQLKAVFDYYDLYKFLK